VNSSFCSPGIEKIVFKSLFSETLILNEYIKSGDDLRQLAIHSA
jgi:hypothetical protein